MGATPDLNVKGYTLGQKLVGKACGKAGIVPGEYCEPEMGTVGSQDTTGPMTRDELKDLACVGFSADLTMQSFCHTAAYPKPVDVTTHRTLPKFISERGGVALRPGDGIIHSWLNRMLLPKIGKKNIFNGRVLEIEGLPDLKCEQAFELSDASAERSAAGCTIKLNKEPVIEYLTSNIT